ADVRSLVAMAISDMDIDHALPRLTIPTLVMAGANDRLTPPVHAQRMADVLPSLESLVVLPATGHMGPLERPDDVADALVALASSPRVAGSATHQLA
ncbi:MAG: alpha/beta fold hydrolase, partial [Solirubrobacteraceae bacterium]